MIIGASLTTLVGNYIGVSAPMFALICVALACGTPFSHVNDSGFWMANRYLGMSVADTLKSWTAMKTLVGITGLIVCLIISMFLGG